MEERGAGRLDGLASKLQRRLRRCRGMSTCHPRALRSFGRAHPVMFRLTGGRIGGTLQGTTIGLLMTTGRRRGQTRVVAVGYEDDAPACWLGPSHFGLDTPSAWFLNLRADPHAEFHTRAGVERVVACELTGPEREDLWPRLLEHHPVWGACQSGVRSLSSRWEVYSTRDLP